MSQRSTDQTIVSLFLERVEKDAERIAIHRKIDGQYKHLTWRQLAHDVFCVVQLLRELGVKHGESVVQFSENRYEWIVSDLAIQIAGAVHVPLHAPLTGEQATFQISDCGARIVLLSGCEQAKKLAACAEALPSDLVYLSYDACEVSIGKVRVRPLADRVVISTHSQIAAIAENAWQQVTPDSLATILYTSGTTGEPKGVMLSQRNLASNALATVEAFGLDEDELRLNFLPLSHIFARTCDLYTWLVCGSYLALAESRETILEDCALVKPTIINGVPYFFERVLRGLVEAGRAKEPGSLRALLGGNVRLCCSGGAALPNHVFDFYLTQDVPILQGYGLTESSPVITLTAAETVRRGAVGKTIPGVEIRIAEDGEILTRGPHVMMGYYNNAQATDDVLRDGWLHTGDIGHLDEDGFLFITGRKKEIIVTSGGKNVAPVYLESLLTEDPLILQAIVIGNDRDYLSALIVPDPDNLRNEIKRRKIFVLSKHKALKHPKVLALYEERIHERLRSVSHYEQVQKFTLLDRGFTVESAELTPKLSLRRKEIQEHFRDKIDAMYEARR
jgi:long-chain acyl-CoA synthetase